MSGRGSRLARTVARRTWDLERFGLTPAKLARRAGRGGERPPVVFTVSVPKAGTHLLERALCLHPALHRRLMPTVHDGNLSRWGGLEPILARLRPGEVIVSHLSYRASFAEVLAGHGVPGVFITRHPRDVVRSLVHYVADRSDHHLHAAFAAQPDEPARMRLAIEGSTTLGVPSIGDRFRAFQGWLDAPGCLVVRYEDLVGPSGGGDAGLQAHAIEGIFAHLGLPLAAGELRAIATGLFSANSPTFRQGTIGSSRFEPVLEDLFDLSIGDLLARYGYPS